MKYIPLLVIIYFSISLHVKLLAQINCTNPVPLRASQREDQICDPDKEEITPWISNDGHRLYYTNTSTRKGKNGIYQASRTAHGSKFTNSRLVCEIPTELNGNLGHAITLTNKEDTIYINSYTSPAFRQKVFAFTRSSITQSFGNKITIDLVGSSVYSSKISYLEKNNSIVVLTSDDGVNGYLNPVMKIFQRETPTTYRFVRKINPIDSIQMRVCRNGVSWIGQSKKSKILYKICSDEEMNSFQIGGRLEMPAITVNRISVISSMNSCFSAFALIATFDADFASSGDILTYTAPEFCNDDPGPEPENPISPVEPENPISPVEPVIPNLVLRSGTPLNRKFVIQNVTQGEITNFQVFNRWGKKIFQQDIYTMNWPDEGINSGIFFYSFRYKSTAFQGWITVEE